MVMTVGTMVAIGWHSRIDRWCPAAVSSTAVRLGRLLVRLLALQPRKHTRSMTWPTGKRKLNRARLERTSFCGLAAGLSSRMLGIL
jgi:hypothetical protein